jgi:glycosyltransferase involved in cell wall biosynthesis
MENTERKNIYYINRSKIEQTGGSEKSTENILNFQDEEHQINYVSPNKLPDSIHVAKEFVAPFGQIKKAIVEIEKEKPDVLILNSPTHWSLAFFLSLPKELQDKTCALWRGTAQSSLFIPTDSKIVNKISSSVVEKLQSFIGKRVKQNFVVSTAVSQSLEKAGVPSEKIVNIGEQVGGEYNPKIRINNKENHRLKYLNPDEFGVLFVGRISPEKGIDWLVQLYKNLRNEIKYFDSDNFKKIKINIAGPTDLTYADSIKKQINQITKETNNLFKADNVQIEFLGEKSKDQLQELYNIHDLLFMPSPAEGFGRVTAEALSAGLPIIGRTGCVATEEILSNSPYSIGTTVDNINEAVTEIFYLANNPETLDQLKINAYKWACNFYTQENTKKRFLKAIDQLEI